MSTDGPLRLNAGMHIISKEAYLADPCPEPSLSSSVARTLLMQSPAHAWHEHCRLNPDYKSEERESFDVGTALHAYLLEGETGFRIIDARDWRTAAAKAERDAARAEGKTPLLAEQWTRVQAMAEQARFQLWHHQAKPAPLDGDGAAERTLIWQDEGDVWCRARLDWLHGDRRTVDDVKTTSGSASPLVFSRRLFEMGYDIQAALYLRGMRKVFGNVTYRWRWVVIETEPPHALTVMDLSPMALDMADRKALAAIRLWGECLKNNKWPGYPTDVCTADLPPWEEARWLELTA